MTTQDELNQAAWRDDGAVRGFSRAEGFTDEGERACYFMLVDEVRSRPILDLGAGGGRTVPLLRALSSDYTAIDYLPEMVAACRHQYPFVDVAIGDARDLARFTDNRFYLVSFSFNGIDAIDHEGRQRVLREVRRVLMPGGIFWFSTLNRDGLGPRARPWKPPWPKGEASTLTFTAEALRAIAGVPKNVRNYMRVRRMRTEGDGWCLAPFAAHNFGLLVHYTTLERELAELGDAGYRPDPTVIESSFGRRVASGDDLCDVYWFHILARK